MHPAHAFFLHISRRGPPAVAVLLLATCLVFAGPVDADGSEQTPPGAPALFSSSYLGGTGRDFAHDVALAPNGDIVVVGTTDSSDFPARSAPSLHRGGHSGEPRRDAFVVRLTPDATTVVWSLVLGGSDDDSATSVAVDPAGTIVVAGTTSSRDFPTAQPFQPALGGKRDLFVSALAPDGSLQFSTYLGGAGSDQAGAIASGPAGVLYLTGSTASPDFPTRNAYDPIFRGESCSTYEYERRCEQVFVAALSRDGRQLEFSTFLGGALDDHGTGIVVDAEGSVVVTGDTSSTDFPTAHAFQQRPGGSPLDHLLLTKADSFVARLSPGGRALVYSTYLGGAGWDGASDIALDPDSGDVVVVGTAGSRDFPATYRFGPGSEQSAFVARVAPDGELRFSGQLGGAGSTLATAVALDEGGEIVLVGSTDAPDFPAVNAVQRILHQGDRHDRDVFVAAMSADGVTLRASTFLGGRSVNTDGDSGKAVAVGRQGQILVAGATSSGAALAASNCPCPDDKRIYGPPSDFPLARPFQPAHAGGSYDAFVAGLRLDGGTEQSLVAEAVPRNGVAWTAGLLALTLFGALLITARWWRRRTKGGVRSA